MISLPWIFKLNNYISENFYRPPPNVWDLFIEITNFHLQEVPLWTIILILTEK